MTSRLRILATRVVVAGVVLFGTAPVKAQSLADVARREEARRKDVKPAGKTYTNKDLGEVALPLVAATPDEAKPPAANTPAPTGKEAAKDKAAKDQAYWGGRLKDLSTQLSRDESYADALQVKINALTADFTARDDPAQRDRIFRDRQKALDELDRLKKSIQADKKAIADFQEEARRAAVPPGWLR